MKVMLDTNILVSVIFFPSDQTRALVKTIAAGHQILLCDYVIDELRLVVERKFPARKEALEQFFVELPFSLVHTPKILPIGKYPSVRDGKDTPILATAIMEDVDLFITGDKDFLVLETETPKMMTMKDFLEQYQ